VFDVMFQFEIVVMSMVSIDVLKTSLTSFPAFKKLVPTIFAVEEMKLKK
jgi:hypothetical protein